MSSWAGSSRPRPGLRLARTALGGALLLLIVIAAAVAIPLMIATNYGKPYTGAPFSSLLDAAAEN
jgi:hypothetical protein